MSTTVERIRKGLSSSDEGEQKAAVALIDQTVETKDLLGILSKAFIGNPELEDDVKKELLALAKARGKVTAQRLKAILEAAPHGNRAFLIEQLAPSERAVVTWCKARLGGLAIGSVSIGPDEDPDDYSSCLIKAGSFDAEAADAVLRCLEKGLYDHHWFDARKLAAALSAVPAFDATGRLSGILASTARVGVYYRCIHLLERIGVPERQVSAMASTNVHAPLFMIESITERNGMLMHHDEEEILDVLARLRSGYWRLLGGLPIPLGLEFHGLPSRSSLWDYVARIARSYSLLAARTLCTPFEKAMGLHVTVPVRFENRFYLRFSLLASVLRHGKEDGRDWLGGIAKRHGVDLDVVIGKEKRLDELLDRLDDLMGRLDDLLEGLSGEEREIPEDEEEAGKRHEDRKKDPRIQELGDEIAKVRGLPSDGAAMEGGDWTPPPDSVNGIAGELEEATGRLAGDIRQGIEDGEVDFGPVTIENILGEYFFRSKTVAIYVPMISLVAASLGMRLGWPQFKAEARLYAVVGMHESAHAAAHLGEDEYGKRWQDPGRATPALHETLAQYYTFIAIDDLKLREVARAFLELNRTQPGEYVLWRYLERADRRELRSWFLASRDPAYRPRDLVFVLERILGFFEEELATGKELPAEVRRKAGAAVRKVRGLHGSSDVFRFVGELHAAVSELALVPEIRHRADACGLALDEGALGLAAVSLLTGPGFPRARSGRGPSTFARADQVTADQAAALRPLAERLGSVAGQTRLEVLEGRLGTD